MPEKAAEKVVVQGSTDSARPKNSAGNGGKKAKDATAALWGEQEKQRIVDFPHKSSESLLQRILMPRIGDPFNVRSLYLDEAKSNKTRTRVLSRSAARIPAQSEVSFATYFNAFPASYWRRWTTVDTVELRLVVEGDCRIDIYRSKANGIPIHVHGETIESGGHSFSLSLAPFEDGGWYWYDLTSEDEEITLLEGGWYATVPTPGRASVAIGIPSFNRPVDCVAALGALGEDPLVLDAVKTIFVIDQGTKKVRDTEGFDVAAKKLGDRLRIFDQPNLGGSGGYARVMYESLRNTDCEQILYMDDDIAIEPDAILRAVAFSRFAENPMLVGGQMLNLQARSQLHTMGEVVDRQKFFWRAAPHVVEGNDFAKKSLRQTTWLHRRIDVDYNGWWMCLIPRTIAEKIGLALPLFIKWDDAEYGLRCAEAGYPTATVPGIAIWHMNWMDKDDAADWQAYFHLRNRLVVAAMHSPYSHGKRLLKDTFRWSLKYLLSLQYSTVALHQMAIQDFLHGPNYLFKLLPEALGEVRAKRSTFDDGQVLPSSRQLPLPSMDAVKAERFMQPPGKKLEIAKTIVSSLVRNMLPPHAKHLKQPQLNIAAQDARWFLLARIDGATVATADGSGVAFRKRNPKTFWNLFRQMVVNHVQLFREFPRLRTEYRKALPELTSQEAWHKIFKDNLDA